MVRRSEFYRFAGEYDPVTNGGGAENPGLVQVPRDVQRKFDVRHSRDFNAKPASGNGIWKCPYFLTRSM